MHHAVYFLNVICKHLFSLMQVNYTIIINIISILTSFTLFIFTTEEENHHPGRARASALLSTTRKVLHFHGRLYVRGGGRLPCSPLEIRSISGVSATDKDTDWGANLVRTKVGLKLQSVLLELLDRLDDG